VAIPHRHTLKGSVFIAIALFGHVAFLGCATPETFENKDQPALLNKGNPSAIVKAMEKAKRGETVTIGAIGGSITAGAAASDFERSAYAPLIVAWWRKTFPDATIEFVNAGIGATNSIFGVHRINSDLLYRQPDVVMVEFSVNDIGVQNAQESYEGLIRNVLKQENKPGVLALALMNEHGENWQDQHLAVAKHYDVPMLSYRDAVWPDVAAGRIKWQDISPDEVHPNDRGHAMIASIVINYLEDIYRHSEEFKQQSSSQIVPLTKNGYENASIIDAADLQPLDAGDWQYDATGRSWHSCKQGKPLVVEVIGRYVSIMFLKTNKGTGAKATAIIDQKSIALSADFPGGWGEYYELVTLSDDSTYKRHRIELHFDDDREETEFKLLKLLVCK